MRVLAVDDEKLGLARLERLLTSCGVDDITAIQEPQKALEIAHHKKFDVLFLDISMPTMSGLVLAQKILDIEPQTFIVFQTAFSEYALEAYDVGGIGYILKPYEKSAIMQALQKVKQYQGQTDNHKKLLGKLGDRIYLISLDEIFYVKASLDEVIVQTKNGESVYVKKKISEMEILLNRDNFFKIHRSIIVNIEKIRSMQTVEQSKLQIKFEGIDDVVTSSKDGAKTFREYLERRSL
ncbi:MAG: LytTR family DNA-binding domain-containing protein [Epsilonproteobacteria bacterium]|nr:LytTR family DNA-binding domain-containing protein [Campylobacterota bacterium]